MRHTCRCVATLLGLQRSTQMLSCSSWYSSRHAPPLRRILRGILRSSPQQDPSCRQPRVPLALARGLWPELAVADASGSGSVSTQCLDSSASGSAPRGRQSSHAMVCTNCLAKQGCKAAMQLYVSTSYVRPHAHRARRVQRPTIYSHPPRDLERAVFYFARSSDSSR